MQTSINENIDTETIKALGLQLTDKDLNSEIVLSGRMFVYPHLEHVYILESDLYGNHMPEDSCFLAFNGQHGLIGKHLKIEILKHSSVADIQKMVQENNEG